MRIKIGVLIFSGLLLVNIYGCFAVVAGTAGGAGTAAWLSGKLTQQVNYSYEHTIASVKSALRSLNLDINKEARADEVTQIRSEYTDGKKIWIDIRRITEQSSQIEIRVGALPDREAADKILKRIQSRL